MLPVVTDKPLPVSRRLRPRTPRKWLEVAGWYALCISLVAAFSGPFLWMVSSSLKPQNEIFDARVTLISPNMSLDTYREIFETTPFARWMLNSFIVSTSVTLVALLLHSMAGYALARLEFPGRRAMFTFTISTLMIPGTVILIPLALLVKALGWFNTYWALIIPAIPNAFGIFWLRQFFLGMPRDLEDAARIDGASRAGVFWYIALPLARPILASLAVFFFLANWDAYLWPLIVANNEEMRVVQVGITTFTKQYGTLWHFIMAASVISIVPTLLLFFVLQRHIVESVKMAGLKG